MVELQFGFVYYYHFTSRNRLERTIIKTIKWDQEPHHLRPRPKENNDNNNNRITYKGENGK
jgi:hypothetical protein